MKKCPYCAESIQDEAIKCRYCGSDLTVPVPPRAAGVVLDAPPVPEAPSTPEAGTSGPTAAEAGTTGAAPGGPTETTTIGDAATPAQGAAAPSGDAATAAQGAVAPSDTATDPGRASAEATVGEGAIRFSHSGYRYILGFGSDFFGIWDRQAPGGPVMRFPRTDEGWVEAWNRFTVLEPRAMAVQTTAGSAPGVSLAGTTRSTGGLNTWLSWLLALSIPLALLQAGFVLYRIVLLRRVQSEGPGSVTPLQATAADNRIGALGVIIAVLGIAVVVLWLIWQYRSHRNLRAFGLSGLKYSPGWVVGFWLIPFTFPVMPYLTMRELWRGSEPESGAADWTMTRTTPLLPVWWAAFLIPIVLGGIAGGIAGNEATTDLATAIASNSFSFASLLLNAVAAGLAIVLVRRIERRMSAKRERITAWSSAPSAG